MRRQGIMGDMEGDCQPGADVVVIDGMYLIRLWVAGGRVFFRDFSVFPPWFCRPCELWIRDLYFLIPV